MTIEEVLSMDDCGDLERARAIRRALRAASNTIRTELSPELWTDSDILDVLDMIWSKWDRLGNQMREISPDCFSTKENPL